MSRLSVFKELWEFLKENKKYWPIPIIIILLLLGVLLVLAEKSVLAPFIYPLF
jgi:hypothetical protein